MDRARISGYTIRMATNWNPWHGCKKFSPGCQNCYVYRADARYGGDASRIYKTKTFDLPARRGRNGAYKIAPGESVYTCFTSDFFLEDADAWRPAAWVMMRERQDLSFLFLTKRILRFYDCIPPDWGEGYPNVWISCTMENQNCIDGRLAFFKELPIARKGIVCEPLLGPVTLAPHLGPWAQEVVAGGESGEEARHCDFRWILELRQQCVEAGVRFIFKQTGRRFIKDGKTYFIPKKLQGQQARLAGVFYSPPTE